MKILISIMKMLPCVVFFIPTAYYGLTGLYLRVFEGVHPTGLLSFISSVFVAFILFLGVVVAIAFSLIYTIKVIHELLQ